jgi:hypothetical protein
MEKIKFGIQLTILMLAFPVLLVTEMKKADNDLRNQKKLEMMEQQQTGSNEILQKKASFSGLTMIPDFKLMPANI